MRLLGTPFQESPHTSDKISELEYVAMKIEKPRIHYLSNVFPAVAVLASQGPFYWKIGDCEQLEQSLLSISIFIFAS